MADGPSKAGFGRPFEPPFRPAFPQKQPAPPATAPKPPGAKRPGPGPAPPAPGQAPAKPPVPSIPSGGPSNETIDYVANSILESTQMGTIPLLMRRAVVDIWPKPNLLGTTRHEKFRGAIAIGLASLMRAGRVSVNANGAVQLTPRGRIEDAKRSVARDKSLKEAAYRRIIMQVKLERTA